MPELTTYHADLHIHSRYSGATSSRMIIDTIAQQAKLKGLTLVDAHGLTGVESFSKAKDIEQLGQIS